MCSERDLPRLFNVVKIHMNKPYFSSYFCLMFWCPERDSNSHGSDPPDFESCASTNFAIRAYLFNYLRILFFFNKVNNNYFPLFKLFKKSYNIVNYGKNNFLSQSKRRSGKNHFFRQFNHLSRQYG